MQNKDKTKKFTSPTFFPGFTPSFPSPSSPPCDDRGNGACSQCTQFLSAAPFCSRFFPAPACGPSHGIVLHKLFQHGPFPQGTILQEQIAAAGVPHRSYLLPGACSSAGFPQAVGQFLLHFLTPLSQLLCSVFYPFLNTFPQRCHQHHCWAQLWPAEGLPGPALSGCVQHRASPGPFSERPPQQWLLLPKPWHLHPIHDFKPNT